MDPIVIRSRADLNYDGSISILFTEDGDWVIGDVLSEEAAWELYRSLREVLGGPSVLQG